MNDLLAPGAFLAPSVVEDAVTRALSEDLGRAGDITSAATIPPETKATGTIEARKAGVIAGLACAAEAFRRLDPALTFRAYVRDGAAVKEGTVLADVDGSAHAILGAERVALDFLGHLSGIATLTAAYVAKIKGTKAKIADTRKTTPGLRALEKYAVRCGGGINHRFGLDDAVLIKDNHIAIAGGVEPALKRARATVGHLVKVEIEVDSLEQLAEALKAGGADAVLLDNMDLGTLKRAVEMVAGKLITEASGGVTLDSVAAIAATGIDVISVGALTHSAPNLDIGVDL
jgi:nicotinate-nucleotide pyrophosphorylase (carboxylating)